MYLKELKKLRKLLFNKLISSKYIEKIVNIFKKEKPFHFSFILSCKNIESSKNNTPRSTIDRVGIK